MIRHILFDLDCTLYSARYGLEENVYERLKQYLARYLGINVEEASAERDIHVLKGQYGTTLEWLIAEKGFTDSAGYFEYIHPENEAETLPPDPELRRFLRGLPCPCSILTNSPLFHAERIIKKLELEGIFHKIFDIESSGLKGKPNAPIFRRALDALGLKPEEVIFVDDIPRYVEGYIVLGGRGILFDEEDVHTDYPHERIRTLAELTRFLDLELIHQ